MTQVRINGTRLLAEPDDHGRDRRHGQGRRQSPDLDRRGPARPRPVPPLVRGGGPFRHGRPDGQHVLGHRPGRDQGRPPVLVGSHLDSQPTGGKFDGPLGVLAALEVVRTLNDHGIVTQAPLEVVNWTNEEGVRFAPAMIATTCGSASNSGAWSTVKFGSKLARSAMSGRMNMFRTNAMCHALGET